MRKYVYIGLGGAAGAILRYLITAVHVENQNMPISTLFINISGCLALGFILTLALEILEFSPNLRLGIAVGFLGAYTTFSSVCKQTVDLMTLGNYFTAIIYISVSAVLGFGATYFGIILAREVAVGKNKIGQPSESEDNGAD